MTERAPLSARSRPAHSETTTTPKVLLCLGPCNGEFYLPLGWGDAPRCPNDSTHDVAVYSNLIVRRYCDSCGDGLGIVRAGHNLCARCEGVDV